jgi:ABC-type multidrug transport system fused ATPase/permease subunit
MGEMLKRFTVDTQMVDDQLLIGTSDSAEYFIKIAIVVVVGYVTPSTRTGIHPLTASRLCTSKYTSFLTVILLIWCAKASRSYINARTTVKRADAEPTSAILEHFNPSAAGVSTIRAFGVVEKTIEQMHGHFDRLSTARRHFWIFNRWLGLQLSLLGGLFSTGTGMIPLSSKSFIDPSLLGVSLTFSMGFLSAMSLATKNYGGLESWMDALERVTEDTELETEGQDGIEVSEEWPSKGKVEVKELDIAYSPSLPLVLKDVSFVVEGSQKIGIVGRTGAGKSSLTLSFLRLIEPRKGSILADGIDISTVKLRDLRTRITFIPQDPVLFSGTVRSNIDYFKQVSEDKLLDALRRVQLLAEEGDEKPGLFTLDSPISAGETNMSHGQRQLLCLAWVLIKKPRVMILDEATSAVDDKTDLLIQETIKKEFDGRLIVVAHRLRAIAGFDQVMVMSDGKVVEIGKPAELLRKKEMFYELVEDSQDKEFLTQAILK